MLDNKKVLAVIPARSGSKGLVDKNIKDLLGKPLLVWTVSSALESEILDRTIVSSDNERYIKLSREFGADVPFRRPDALSSDLATSESVVLHALDFTEHEMGIKFDYIVLLEPTSPLRPAGLIDNVIQNLHSDESTDAVITSCFSREIPNHSKVVKNGFLHPFLPDQETNKRRQDSQSTLYTYGLVYAIRTDVFRSLNTFYPPKTKAFLVDKRFCFDIDDKEDFEIVESMARTLFKNC